jgi:peptidoglycan hydrolase-like protein with peptidoglycan-binding domain
MSALPPVGGGFASDAQVRRVQQALQAKGMNPGPADGVAGPRTQQAVREFQKEQSLPQTGRLDAQTLQRLGVSPQ